MRVADQVDRRFGSHRAFSWLTLAMTCAGAGRESGPRGVRSIAELGGSSRNVSELFWMALNPLVQ
jgi:hypothetical protein